VLDAMSQVATITMTSHGEVSYGCAISYGPVIWEQAAHNLTVAWEAMAISETAPG